MGLCWGNWRTIDGHPVCLDNAAAKATVGGAAFFVVTAFAGGGVGAASASGSLAESGIPRTFKSQSQARSSLTDITSDTVRATIRLQRAGRYRATAQTSFDDSACDA